MAHIYSAKAPHLSSVKSIRYRPGPSSLLILAFVSACFSWLFARAISDGFTPLARLILFVAVCVVVFNILKEFYIVYRRSNSHRFLFSSERVRENQVLTELALLPADFNIFHRVDLPGAGKIHIIITSPGGVYSLRVRHVSGVVGYNGYEIIHNGGELQDEADLVYLTTNKAARLSEFLTKRAGEKVTVTPVVVFSPDTILTQLTVAENKGSIILNPEFMADYFTHAASFSSRVPVEKINQILLPLVIK